MSGRWGRLALDQIATVTTPSSGPPAFMRRKVGSDEVAHAAGVVILAPRGAGGRPQALFIKRGRGQDHPGEWCFPGGGIEDGEDPVQAAAREAEEEVGFTPTSKLQEVTALESDGVHFTSFYTTTESTFKPILDDESTASVWRTLEDPPTPLHPGCLFIIEELLESFPSDWDELESHANDGGPGSGPQPGKKETKKEKRQRELESRRKWFAAGMAHIEKSFAKPSDSDKKQGDDAANEASEGELRGTIKYPPKKANGGTRSIDVSFARGGAGKTLKESPEARRYNTTTKDASIQCPRCGGSGRYDRGTCFQCHGTGFVNTTKAPSSKSSLQPYSIRVKYSNGSENVANVYASSRKDAESIVERQMRIKGWNGKIVGDEKVAKGAAEYTDGPVDSEPCKSCTMFVKGGSCTKVEGEIEPQGHCKFYYSAEMAKGKDDDEIDSELEQEEIHGKRPPPVDELPVDKSYPIRWMSVMSESGDKMYLDETLPDEIENNGKTLVVAEPLKVHEHAEFEWMQTMVAEFIQDHGREPDDAERKQIYVDAHNKAGLPAERKWIDDNGYSWSEWEAWCRGKLASLETEKEADAPKDADVRPVEHGRGQLESTVGEDSEFEESKHPRDESGKFGTGGVSKHEHHAKSLTEAIRDNEKFDTLIAKIEKDPSIKTADMREIARHFLGYEIAKKKGRADALKDIRDRQAISARQEARARQLDKSLNAWGKDSEFEESKHPRDPDGKFGSGAGGSKLDMSKLQKVGGKLGSNEGGTFKDSSGNKFYVKKGKSPDHVKNELLAGSLYDLAGANTLKYHPVEGGNHIATEWQQFEKNDARNLTPEEKKAVQKDFAVHAWTANWDAAGLDYDNQSFSNGESTTNDLGGALTYRAQGAPKGDKFGNMVGEWDTLRDPNINPQNAKLFGGMTDAQLKESAKRVTDIPDAEIRRTVKDNGLPDAMVDKLIARKQDIAKKAGVTLADGASLEKNTTHETMSGRGDEVLFNARAVAEQQGFDPEKISVSDEIKTFTLGGKEYKYAGAAHLDTGKITLYPNVIHPGTSIGIAVHEIMHQKFESVFKAYQEERDKISKRSSEMDWSEDAPMRPDGSLREQYAKEYPLFAKMGPIFDDSSKLHKDDGINDYSKAYWDSWKKGEIATKFAVHETLAEMARLHLETGEIPGTGRWKKLYKAVIASYPKVKS